MKTYYNSISIPDVLPGDDLPGKFPTTLGGFAAVADDAGFAMDIICPVPSFPSTCDGMISVNFASFSLLH